MYFVLSFREHRRQNTTFMDLTGFKLIPFSLRKLLIAMSLQNNASVTSSANISEYSSNITVHFPQVFFSLFTRSFIYSENNTVDVKKASFSANLALKQVRDFIIQLDT